MPGPDRVGGIAVPRVSPYGSWKSPITTDLIVAETVALGQIVIDGPDIYWLEMRPSEGGRSVVVRRTPDGKTSDMNSPPYDVRTRVHEYGGGAYAVADGVLYFSNFSDQRLYRQAPEAPPEPLTPEAPMRYADGHVDSRRQTMYCVREDHRGSDREAQNTIVALRLEGGDAGRVLVSGNDFYSSPRLSPDGRWLAWLTWNHPNMPWDGTELWMGELDSRGNLVAAQLVGGGPQESIFQPEWSPDGTLYFVSDRTGWWNLYRYVDGQAEPLWEKEAEFGRPQWVFGMSTYAFESRDRLVCAYCVKGRWRLATLDISSLRPQEVPLPYTEIAPSVRALDGHAVIVAGSPTLPLSVVRVDLDSGEVEILRRSTEVEVDPGYLSEPEVLEFPSERGWTSYAFYYPPKNKDFTGPPDERPPLLVMSHGGPTSSTTTALSLGIQYWTSRGIAVLDVNYGGSTGYGREYRERLRARWGIVDVNDCVKGALHLAKRGEVDRDRLAIRGGSAGGYTTLCALTFTEVFKAGASYYGVSDLEALARETHKFESSYLDGLIGPYPERRDLYVERSPIHHTERLSCPVILLQGTEDRVVPPNQAELMVQALRSKGLPVAYVTFEGEQHGFRRAESIKRALESELFFYSKVFGFELADPVEPVDIENL